MRPRRREVREEDAKARTGVLVVLLRATSRASRLLGNGCEGLVPSPGTPGEGEGDLANVVRRRCEHPVIEITLTPALSRSTGRGRLLLARATGHVSRNNLPHHVPVHLRQPEVPAGVAVGQPGVVQAELVEDGG